MARETGLVQALLLRITREDLQRLDGLAARLPGLPRTAVARFALRIGLAEAAGDPARFLELAASAEKKSSKKKPSP